MNSSRADCELAATICSRLTPRMPAAIATIAVRGPRAVAIVCKVFTPRRRANTLEIGAIICGLWRIRNGELSEEVVVCRSESNQVEINCHGGIAIADLILQDLIDAGCEIVSAEDWPAAGQGQIESAAESDLWSASTVRVAGLLLDQMRGSFSVAIRKIADCVERHEFDCGLIWLNQLIDSSNASVRLCNSPLVCLCGPPNVGKSSLMNALAGSQKAIVHSQPGTTRDAVETQISLDGWPITLVDTAGIRPTDDPIEIQGVDISQHLVRKSNLLLLVIDARVGWTQEHQQILGHAACPIIAVLNKSDLCNYRSPPVAMPIVVTSALRQTGIDLLQSQIAKLLFSNAPNIGTAAAFRQTHLDQLCDARTALIDGRTDEALKYLIQMLR